MSNDKDWNDIGREQGPERSRETFNEEIKQAHARLLAGDDAPRDGDKEQRVLEEDFPDDEPEPGPDEPPPPPPPPPPLPVSLPDIFLVGGNLLTAIEQAESAILAAAPPRLFQRGGMLVRLKRIAQKETIKGITRDAGSLIIAEATPECVRLEMARTARYHKWNERKRSHVETDPLISYARALAAKNEFPFKTLLATIETPTLRADGSVLQDRGYDEATGSARRPFP